MTDPTLDALRALVQKWRQEANGYPVTTDTRAEIAQAAVRLCASELEAVISAALASASVPEGAADPFGYCTYDAYLQAQRNYADAVALRQPTETPHEGVGGASQISERQGG